MHHPLGACCYQCLRTTAFVITLLGLLVYLMHGVAPPLPLPDFTALPCEQAQRRGGRLLEVLEALDEEEILMGSHTVLSSLITSRYVPYAQIFETPECGGPGVGYDSVVYKANHYKPYGKPSINLLVISSGNNSDLGITLSHLHYSMDDPVSPMELSVIVTVVEHSPYPTMAATAAKYHCDYLHIPVHLSALYGSGEWFSKSFAVNFAYLWLPVSSSYLILEEDVLVSPLFFASLTRHEYPPSYQNCYEIPFTSTFGISSARISTMTTELNLSGSIVNRTRFHADMRKQHVGLAEDLASFSRPLSAIHITREAFQLVGGYDPELFFSRSAFDDLFLIEKLNSIRGHFVYDFAFLPGPQFEVP